MGRTNIGLDDALLAKAMRLTGARIALRRLVDKGGGKLAWAGDVGAWRSPRAPRS